MKLLLKSVCLHLWGYLLHYFLDIDVDIKGGGYLWRGGEVVLSGAMLPPDGTYRAHI